MLNLFLNKEITRAEKIILDTEIAGKTVSFDDFKSAFLNLQESDFFAWHDRFVQYRQAVGEMKDSTLVRYESQRNKLKQFKQEILMTDITSDFVHKYNDFLAETLNNSHNTRQKSLSYLKSIFEYAKSKGAASGNPFDQVNMAPKYAPRTFLTNDEVTALWNLYQSSALKDAFQHVLKKFLWSCYTGQAFGDMMEARYADIIEISGHHCLSSNRYKTDKPYFVPLLEVPMQLIAPFPEQLDQKIFRSISNQKYNSTIKEVVKIVGIKKKVTSHTARHTCGHLLVSHGVPRDVIMQILGHSRLNTTQHYSQMMPEDLIRAIKVKLQ
jgi:site-specific recombinase XerD